MNGIEFKETIVTDTIHPGVEGNVELVVPLDEGFALLCVAEHQAVNGTLDEVGVLRGVQSRLGPETSVEIGWNFYSGVPAETDDVYVNVVWSSLTAPDNRS